MPKKHIKFDYNETKLQIKKLLISKENPKLLKELQDKINYFEYGYVKVLN